MTIIITILVSLCFLYFWYFMLVERNYIKQEYYGSHNHFNVHSSGDGKPQATALTPQEQRIYEALSKTNTPSLYGRLIKNTIERADVQQFRQLLKELSDQKRDAPEDLKRIIGIEAFDMLS